MSINRSLKNSNVDLSSIFKLGITLASLVLVFAFCSTVYAADQYSENIIPVMTSATSPAPFVITSDKPEHSSNNAYKAFDHSSIATNSNGSDYWYTTSGPASLTVDIGTLKKVQKINLTSFNVSKYDGEGSVKNWELYGSNDGKTYTLITNGLQENTPGRSFQAPSEYATLAKSYEFENNNSYRYYKFQIVDSYYSYSAGIVELEMFEKLEAQISSPSNLTAISGDEIVSLNWDLVAGATGYNIKRAANAGGPYTTIASSVTEGTYTDKSVTNGTTYYYVVSAIYSTAESSNSNEVSATPQATKPSVPTLSGTAVNALVELNWNAVEKATGYNVKKSTTAGGPYTILKSGITDTNYTDSAVTNGKTYYYVVSAMNDTVESDNSNEVSVTLKDVLNKLKLVLEVNEEKQLSVSEDVIDNSDMTWTSSDISIATVDVNGKVNALKPGNTVVTSTSKDGSYTETINVLVIDLSYQLAVDLKVGETCRLTVDNLANATNVTWTAYDTSIATVSSKGKVTAVKEGLTYVTATDADGKEIGRIYIRVRK